VLSGVTKFEFQYLNADLAWLGACRRAARRSIPGPLGCASVLASARDRARVCADLMRARQHGVAIVLAMGVVALAALAAMR